MPKKSSVKPSSVGSQVWDEKRALQVLEMWHEGRTLRDIAQRLCPPVTNGRVHQILRKCEKHGHVVHWDRIQPKRPRKPVAPEIVERILAIWPKNGECYVTDIAKRLDVPYLVVQRVRKEHNLPYVIQHRNQKIRKKEYGAIRKAYRKGVSVRALAEQYGVCTCNIYHILRGNIGGRPPKEK